MPPDVMHQSQVLEKFLKIILDSLSALFKSRFIRRRVCVDTSKFGNVLAI